MPTATAELDSVDAEMTSESLDGILHDLGDVPPSRVIWLYRPATDDDQIRFVNVHKRLVDLVDGLLVEKVVGQRESLFATTLLSFIVPFVRKKNLGTVSMADAIMRLRPGLNRLPDVSFTAWSSLPNDTAHLKSIADYPPDLAVEVISVGDRPDELTRKLNDYFTAGTKLVWIVDPAERTVEVITGPGASTTLTASDTLSGGTVLPGFEMPLEEYFNDPQLNPRTN